MNWKRGVTRLWLVASGVWIASVVGLAFWSGHYVLTKPNITIQWGDEQLSYPAGMTEEAIRAALQKHASDSVCKATDKDLPPPPPGFKLDKPAAAPEEVLPPLPPGAKPINCVPPLPAGVVWDIPSGWEESARYPPVTYFEELIALLPTLFFPPLLIWFGGLCGLWVVRGFK